MQARSLVERGGVRAYLGVPLMDRAGLVVGALCVHDVQVRTWTPADVGVLSELAASVVAELELLAVTQELGAGAAHVELAMSAAGAGAFNWHIDSGRLVFDDLLVELFGHTREDFDGRIESFTERIHPDDAERTGTALAAGVERGGDLALDYRVLRPDGSVRRVIGRGRVVGRTDRDLGSFVGVAYDATEQLDTRDRLAQVLATMSDAFLSVDRSWRVTWLNAEAERLLGRCAADVTGKALADTLPQLLAGQVVTHCRPVLLDGASVAFELDDTQTGRCYDVRAWPQPDGLAVSLLDVTARRRAEVDRVRASQEREQAVVERERAYATAETATTRLALLADATARLSASLEPRQVLQALADTVVPALGAWLAVVMSAELAGTLADDTRGDGALRVVLARHAEPGRSDELIEVLEEFSLGLQDERGLGAVLRSGRVDALPAPDADGIAASGPDPDRAARLNALGLGPSLTLPLSSRGRRLATMTVVGSERDALDAALLADLAGRAAVALDNALLYGDERRTGLTLQRSLLPREVPQLPGIELAVRYLPGATGAHVGGDWYQGLQVDGALVLAIGDVMGHGMHSAARMGQLRAIVATLALEGHPPGELLNRLAANVDALLDLELATLLVARYDPRARTLSLASAGHPPLLHAPLDREPYYVEMEPGPPLGTFPGTYPEVVVPLAERDTVVLFTDGLVESREADLDTGLERLRQALVELRLPPEAAADHVLRTMGVTRGGADDVALLVLSHRSLH
ncbi:MAG: SpoIIE family protein phosphatase [Frankiales bacterium]|nr:SpoIIE family protein phosphatase [Frankiales bacterium]